MTSVSFLTSPFRVSDSLGGNSNEPYGQDMPTADAEIVGSVCDHPARPVMVIGNKRVRFIEPFKVDINNDPSRSTMWTMMVD